MPMPKKSLKAPVLSITLPPELVARLDQNRAKDESRSGQFARLLEIALNSKEVTMTRPDFKIEKPVKVGIYESEYVARIYQDKIIVTVPYVRWTDNTGTYDEKKLSIRDQKAIDAVRQEIKDNAETSAWRIIGNHIMDEYLMTS